TSRKREGSKSGTSPASCTARPEGSKFWIFRMPLRPVVRACQKSSTPVPTGVTGPMPVTTTRRSATDVQLRGHELHGLPDGLHAVHLLLGDLDAPLLLEREHRLHQVEGVGVEVLGESRVRNDLVLVDRELLGEDLANP